MQNAKCRIIGARKMRQERGKSEMASGKFRGKADYIKLKVNSLKLKVL